MYEIVFSSGFYDAGLCIEENLDGTPKKIMGRSNKHSPDGAGYYGGVQFIQWVHSGKYVEKCEWITRTNQHMSVQDVADEFGINLSKLLRKYRKESEETMELRNSIRKNIFDTIKNELIEKYAKEMGSIGLPNNLFSYMTDSYEKGVTDALKVMEYIVKQHQNQR